MISTVNEYASLKWVHTNGSELKYVRIPHFLYYHHVESCLLPNNKHLLTGH